MKPAVQPLWVRALLNPDLSPLEFRVWLLLSRYEGRNGRAWPTQETLAADLHLAPESIRRVVKRLAAKGWLDIIRPAHTAPGRGVQYTVHHPTGELGEHPTDGLGVVPANHPTGQAEITPPAKPRHIGRTNSGTNSRGMRAKSSPHRPVQKFAPPTVEAVAEYAAERGYPDFDAERFLEFYRVANWHDGRGQPVRNWKQKLLAVWLKPDGGNGKRQGPVEDDDLTEEEIVAKARAGGSKLAWLTGEVSHA